MRLAVASKDGTRVDEHFGHARQFHVFDVVLAPGGPVVQALELRDVANYCQGGYSDDDAWGSVIAALADCRAVLVAKIGPGPTEKLRKRGIAATMDFAFEPIEPALLACAAQLATDAS